MSRTDNTIRNLNWGIFQRIVALFLPFVTRTVLIKVLGADYLGLNGLFVSVLGLLSLAEMGVSNAVISMMYKPIAENDYKTICALMRLYRKLYHIIGVVIIIFGLLLLPFLKLLINGTVPSDINIYLLFIVYLVNSAVGYFLYGYKNCLFIAHQRNDINSRVQLLFLIVQNVSQIMMVLVFRNYYLYAVMLPLSTIGVNLATAHLANKEFPEYKCAGDLSSQELVEVKKKISGLLLAKVSSTVRSTIDSLFVSAFLGLTAVAMYTNYFCIVSAVTGLIQLIEPALTGSVGNSLVTETKDKNLRDMYKFTFILQWIVGFCSICVLCLIQPFMRVWMGEKLMFNDLMALLCAVYVFANSIGLVRLIYTQSLGLWWSLRYISIIDVFVNLVLNYFLCKYMGAYGILLATVIDIIVVSIPWTTYQLFKEYFGKEYFSKYILSYLRYFIVAVAIGAITYSLCQNVCFANSFGTLVVDFLICIIVPNALYFVLFHKNQYFRYMMQIIRPKITRKHINR